MCRSRQGRGCPPGRSRGSWSGPRGAPAPRGPPGRSPGWLPPDGRPRCSARASRPRPDRPCASWRSRPGFYAWQLLRMAHPRVDGLDDSGGDPLGRADPVDRHQLVAPHVPGDEGLGLLLVEAKPPLDRVLRVVFALDDLSPAPVAGPVVPRRLVDAVVAAAVAAD